LPYLPLPKPNPQVIDVIANPKWFCPRKFGWGLGVNSAGGIAYIAAIVILIGIAWNLPIELGQRAIVSTVIIALVVIDTLDVMRTVYSQLDEREKRHQLEAERNASFVAVAGLVAYGLYLGFTLAPEQINMQLMPLMGIALAMAAAKGATLLYLEKER